MPDAIVIGSGPNGLVAANLLAEAGWSVEVLEAASAPGGAVKSSERMEPGFVNDHFSAFYPLGVASPVMRSLRLEDWGLVWRRSPLVLAHPARDGSCPVISQNLDETVASFEAQAPGDGEAWVRLYGLWERFGADITEALFRPFPPVRTGARLARQLRGRDLLRFARFGLLPTRTFGDEYFHSPATKRVFAGLALHADLHPESSLSGFFGWFLASMAQDGGFPVPEGGAGALSAALVRRLEAHGGRVRCNAPVASIDVRGGKARGIRLTDGERIEATRAVLADVNAPTLYRSLLPEESVPTWLQRDLDRFSWDNATVKVDWNLDGPIPWAAADARRAGTVHITESVDELSRTSSELARNLAPQTPFLLFGQYSMADNTRSPAGKETAWAYTHVPIDLRGDAKGEGIDGAWTETQRERFADRMQDHLETLAPGFGASVRHRLVFGPDELQASDANLFRGAVGGGTSALHQQLVFRPIPGLGRSETIIPGLYLASSNAHPGGGVHGACGANAARAALAEHQRPRLYRVARAVGSRVMGGGSVLP